MEAILDFSSDLNIGLLDKIVTTFYSSAGPERQQADKVLTQFREHPESWKRVDAILTHSQVLQTRYFALQILENVVKTMWKALPSSQREGIKSFIVAFVIKTTSDDQSLEKNKLFVGKLNMVLVQILKQEWPHNWPTFIPEIVTSSKSNLALCENNMAILKLLSEEIFDFSAEQMTQQKTKNLKNQMCGEFSEIFKLCHEILEKAQKPSLIKATLETLLRFLNWIPLGYIFETNLIDILKNRFLETAMFRNVTLKCLTEIGALKVGPEYDNKFVVLYGMVMSSITNMIPLSAGDLAKIYDTSTDDDQQFIQNLSIFLTSFFSAHLRAVESAASNTPTLAEHIQNGHMYLILISLVREREIFKICLEYWLKMVSELFEEMQNMSHVDTPLLNLSPMAMHPGARLSSISLRKNTYSLILSKLRVVMIERMAKPEEVLIVENEEGEIVRELVKESDTIVLYKSMKEALVYLTHLDVEDTELIMSDKLSRQMDGSEWSWDNLNTLCWAIGSISGAMSEEMEKRFLVTVIKDLLGLVEMKRGKDNKAVVASNIMYVVGQYPRFLKAHWKFLKTVVNKLFEFMHEFHEGVQDMACDTFIKIAQKCKKHFVLQQPNEVMPYIEEILASINQITSDLSPQQVHTFYEAVGYMISAQPNRQIQERLITKFMELPNTAWEGLMLQAKANAEVLNDAGNIKILGNILKTNVAACSSVGAPFISQLLRIYVDMLELYKAVSGLISASVVSQGDIATKTPRVRGFRTIKKEILKLVETYVQKAEDLNAVNDTLIPPLLEATLLDYARNEPQARESEVLSVVAVIVTRLGGLMSTRVGGIFEAVFECTLGMINKNFEDFPEHRVGFYKLLQTIDANCFPALLQLAPQKFKLFMDSIVWAIKHTMRDIGDLGLQICMELLNNFNKSPTDISGQFYQLYYLSILQDIFFVLTSGFHNSGFKSQTLILMQMFHMVEDNMIVAPLFRPDQVSDPNTKNQDFLRQYVSSLLQNAFPHLLPPQIKSFVDGLFDLSKDYPSFKSHVRDFLIQIKELAGDELYLEEREAEAAKKKRQEMENALRIPGMVKPSERQVFHVLFNSSDDDMLD